MGVVVDASVLVAAVLDPGPDGDWAARVLADEHLAAPQLAPIEAANALRGAALARKISHPEATAKYRQIIDLGMELLDFEPFARRIWELRFNLSPYDAWYVACAESQGVPLATLDARIRRAPGPTCGFLMPDRVPGVIIGVAKASTLG